VNGSRIHTSATEEAERFDDIAVVKYQAETQEQWQDSQRNPVLSRRGREDRNGVVEFEATSGRNETFVTGRKDTYQIWSERESSCFRN